MLSAWLVVGLLSVTGAEASPGPSFIAVGSAEQVYVTGLAPYARTSLITAGGQTLSTQNADSLGGLLFRNVAPGKGYRVLQDAAGTESGRITVHGDRAAPWDPSVYRQSIPDNGYTYLTTRDGTKLAIDVHPPTSPAGEPGLPSGTSLPKGPDFLPPYPTLIEYSGYGYADPAGPVNGIAVLANLMGFAVVDVNMRGTGCSGGAYDFFETLQNLDGYDVIETIAHQPWVLDHKVGMMGISYGAISQLFTAQLDPPISRRFRRSRPSTPQLRPCIRVASSTAGSPSHGHSSGKRRQNPPDQPVGNPGRTRRSRVATRRASPTRCSMAKLPT